MTAMLASVTSLPEARSAVAAGADIIDLKDPGRGALGALDEERRDEIVAALSGQVPISATLGDLSLDDPAMLRDRVAAMADSGVDYVKLGLFAGRRRRECLQAATDVHARLVLVLFAERCPDWQTWLAQIAECGYAGAMLDTADKRSGCLSDHLSDSALADFIIEAHACGLFAGLAGSLRTSDIPRLLPLRPDYLGFRGALCHQGARTQALHRDAIAAVRALIPGEIDQAASF